MNLKPVRIMAASSVQALEVSSIPRGFGIAYRCPNRFSAYVIAVMPLNLIIRCAVHIYSRLAGSTAIEAARNQGYAEGRAAAWAAAKERYGIK
jgi:hypothetical protein